MNVIYIDIFFITNFFTDFFLLYLTGKSLYLKIKIVRFIITCIVSSLYSILMTIFPIPDTLSLILNVLVAAFMTHFALKVSGKLNIVKSTVLFITLSMMLSGLILVFTNIFSIPAIIVNGKVMYPLPIYTMPVAIIMLFIITKSMSFFIKNRIFARHNRVDITITKDSKSCTLTAFLDTGNLLCDPISGRKVLLCDFDSVRSLLDEDTAIMISQKINICDIFLKTKKSGYFLIPYSAVNQQDSFLLSFIPDSIIVSDEKIKIYLDDFMVAIAPSLFGNDKTFNAIINPAYI